MAKYFDIYIYINIYYMMISFRCHEDMSLIILMPYNGYIYIYDIGWHEKMIFLWWWLRSTTGPYGRPMLEVAYREMLCSLHRGCMGVDSSGRVVGVSTWRRPCWTYPGQHQCGLTIYYFQDFLIIKTKYIYIYDFQSYTLYKRTLVVSDLVLARWGSENVFDRPLAFQKELC